MPIYEFCCDVCKRKDPDNSITELITTRVPEVTREVIDCKNCKGYAKRIPSVFRIDAIAPAVVYFENPKTREIKSAMSSGEKPPKGFIAKEAKGQRQRLGLEKKLNNQQQIENEILSDNLEWKRKKTRKNRHEHLRSEMSMHDSHTQNLIKAAMDRSDKKTYPRKKSEIRMNINHMDYKNIIK